MDANERPVSYASLAGKWEIVGSEIPEMASIGEWYHFSHDEFWWDFLHEGGRKELLRFTYEILEGEVRFKGRNTNGRLTLVAFHIDEYLVFRPLHGMESWMKRVGEFGDLNAGNFEV